MFDSFERKEGNDLTDELISQTKACVHSIGEKWIYCDKTLVLKEGIPLSEKIETFIIPISEYVEKYYPLLMIKPDHFWLMLFTAVLESKTHPTDVVNAAIAELEKNYAS